MSKDDYLIILRENLINMSDDDKDDAIRYYMEYFADAGIKNEQRAIEELGSPELLGKKLSAECAGKSKDEAFHFEQKESEADYREESEYVEYEERKGMGLWKLIALILTFPVWGPLGLAAIILVISLILVAVILVACLFIAGGALGIGGVIALLFGILGTLGSLADGLLSAGVGLMAVAGGIFLLFAGKLAAKGFSRIIRRNR